MGPDEQLREEFNRWAVSGRGLEMERHHSRIAEKTIEQMGIGSKDRILELGCGVGWACRRLACLVPEGLVVGLDISDEMIHQARAASCGQDNILFICSGAEEIPWKEDFFSHALSVESFYYYPDPVQALRETFRVLAPAGRLFMLINLYSDNAESLQWVQQLKAPVKVLSAAEWVQLFREAGFEKVKESRVLDDRPIPETYQGQWFGSPDQFQRFLEAGSLLVIGEKTEPTTASRG